jgi:hypothetical protein
MELEGNIGAFSLRELIEMVVYSSVTGVIEVGDGERGGQLYFRDGLPYHAACGGLTGFDAAALLFNSQGLPFRFEAGTTSGGETLWMDPWELIERGEERAVQWAHVHPYIPGMDWVPALRTTTAADHIHISEETWPVLSAVDGQRSVTQIGEHLDLALVDVCQALAQLVEQKLIVLYAPQEVPRPPEAQAPFALAVPSDESGFFERLIAKTLEEERRRTSDPNVARISDGDIQARVGHG